MRHLNRKVQGHKNFNSNRKNMISPLNGNILVKPIRNQTEKIFKESDSRKDLQYAVVVAAQRRMRPILLTTVTTVGGLLPLWFGGGIMWEPMAIAIIFGLIGATFLTLGVVPVLYAIMFRVSYSGFEYNPSEVRSGDPQGDRERHHRDQSQHAADP